MPALAPSLDNLTLSIVQEIHVRSSLTATFSALLEQLGPANEGHDGTPIPMVLEARPGGRWFRDLGGDNGHFWGVVQAIKRPTLLEIGGPLMHIGAGDVERPVPSEGSRWRHAHHSSSHRPRIHARRLS